MYTSESTFQAKCFQWAWNYLPETRGLLCYNLGNSKNAIQGAHNKAMGLIAGRSDMVLYHNGTATHIELKLHGQKQSESQKKWEKIIKNNGFEYHLIDNFEAFKQLIQDKMK